MPLHHDRGHLGWHRTYDLPHFDQPGLIQSINFHLYDAIPSDVYRAWLSKLDSLGIVDLDARERALRSWASTFEDLGHGAAWLGNAEIADLVQSSLLYFHGERYSLHAWCVMPNHVHALAEIYEGHPLDRVIQSWKSYTAHEANQILGRTGEFWMSDYWDRFVRNVEHYSRAVQYIEENPVKARLVRRAEEWRWSSAWGG